MSLQRIVLTPEQVRGHKLSFPPIGQGAIVMVDAKTRHLTNSLIIDLALTLLGPELTMRFVQEAPQVLIPWGQVLEEAGWSFGARKIDLQVTLIIAGIKACVSGRNAIRTLDREAEAYELIKQIVGVDVALGNALTNSLLLEKGIELPWTLIVDVGPNGDWGTWVNPSK